MTEEFSAGGIVFRKTLNVIPAKAGIQEDGSRIKSGMTESNPGMTIEVLVSQHSGYHGWVFPKGHVGDKEKGETPEQAALREVKEETGIVGEILEKLTPIDYWYVFEGEKRHKIVQYFLMKYVSGTTDNHDYEMEKVEWLPASEVEKRLTFDGDKKVWKVALRAINRRLKAAIKE